MKHSFKIKLPTYNCELHFFVLDGLNNEVNKLYKKYKLNEMFEESAEGVLFSPDIDRYILLIDIKYLTHNTIAHEIFHAVMKITEDRDITDEEAQAWLIGHITGDIYSFLKKKNIQINE
ncbi:MAG: hypothetical protein ACK518_01065 [bacterium]|jgi:hypothetical protein